MKISKMRVRLVLLSGCVVVAACVPASEPLPPAGAAGFVTEPSAAARGEPMRTDDGWEVRFEKLVLRARIDIQPDRSDLDGSRRYAYEQSVFLWNARDRVELFSPGLGPGTWRAGLQLTGGYLPSDDEDFDDDVIDLGAGEEARRRFRSAGDDDALDAPGVKYSQGPAFSFAVSARRDGHAVHLAVALRSTPIARSQDDGARVTVVADRLASMPLPVVAERLFTGIDGDRSAFQPYADADTDGDGHVDANELHATRVRCNACSGTIAPDNEDGDTFWTLLEVLSARAQAMLVTE